MFKNIHLKNFKVFKDARIELGHLNLLTGINGRGKSTLLQALLLCKQTAEEGKLDNQLLLSGDLINLGSYNNIRHTGSRPGEGINIDFAYEDEKGIHLLQYQIANSEKDGKRHTAVITKATLDKTSYDYPNIQQQIAPAKLGLLPQFSPLPFKKIAFVSADRLGPQEVYETTESGESIYLGEQAKYAINTLSERRQELVNEALILGDDDNNSKTLETQVGKWVGEVLMTPRTVINVDNSNTHILSLFFQTGDSKNKFTPPNMGFAFSYILPVIIAGLLVKEGDVLIIENPEAHLHSKAQAKLTEFLVKVANTGVQVILESHSEHILNGLRIAAKKKDVPANRLNVLYFKNDIEEPCLRLPIDQNGDIDLWPDGFFDQYDEDLQTLLGF